MKPKNQQTSDDELQLIEKPTPTPKPAPPEQSEQKSVEQEEAELIAEHAGIIY